MHAIRITVELIIDYDTKRYEFTARNAMSFLINAPGVKEIRAYHKFVEEQGKKRFIYVTWDDRKSWMKFQNSHEWKKMNQEMAPYLKYLMVEELIPSPIFPEPIVITESRKSLCIGK